MVGQVLCVLMITRATTPPEVITGWLGPDSGWLGVLTAVIAGAATPGGPEAAGRHTPASQGSESRIAEVISPTML